MQPTQRVGTSGTIVAAWRSDGCGTATIACNFAYLGRVWPNPTNSLDLDAASALRGDFGLLALSADGLILGRGLGGRPIYYARTDDDVLVACSRLLPLVDMVGKQRLSHRALHAMMSTETSASSATPYAGVKRLLCGTVLLAQPDKVLESRARTLPVRSLDGSPGGLAEACRDVLKGAVTRALRDSTRVAVMVSGGLDSSAVLAHAVTVGRETGCAVVPLNFTFAAKGDDRPHFRALCSYLDVSPVCVSPEQAAPLVVPALVSDGAPVTWPTASWELALMRCAHEHGCSAVLTGVGGDDLFAAGAGTVRASLISDPLLARLRRAAGFRTHWTSTRWTRIYRHVLRPMLTSRISSRTRSLLRPVDTSRRPWLHACSSEFKPRDADPQPVAETVDPHDSAKGFQSWCEGPLTDMLDYRGRLECASQCERRDPFLDDEVIDFAAALPPSAFLQGDDTRGLFRASLSGVLPESLRTRSDKSDFTTALVRMIHSSNLGQLRELATMRCLGELDWVDAAAYRRKFGQQLRRGSGGDWLAVWPALAVEAFVRSRLAASSQTRGA